MKTKRWKAWTALAAGIAVMAMSVVPVMAAGTKAAADTAAAPARSFVFTNYVYQYDVKKVGEYSRELKGAKLADTRNTIITFSTEVPEKGSVITIQNVLGGDIHEGEIREETFDGVSYDYSDLLGYTPDLEICNKVTFHEPGYGDPDDAATDLPADSTVYTANTLQYTLEAPGTEPYSQAMITLGDYTFIWCYDGSIWTNMGSTVENSTFFDEWSHVRATLAETTDSPMATLTNFRGVGAEFNAYAYYMNNPDLQTAIGPNPDALFQHFLTCGRAEGRTWESELELK